jgi:hypothetical protein
MYMSTTVEVQAGQDGTALPAIQESIQAAMDDILSYLSGASLVSGDATEVPGTLEHKVVRVGTPRYLATLFILNIALLLAACIMKFMTKGFCDTPLFNFSDLGAITAATRLSESEDRGERTHYGGQSLPGWDGDLKDRLLRDTKLQIDNVGAQHSSPSVTLLWNEKGCVRLTEPSTQAAHVISRVNWRMTLWDCREELDAATKVAFEMAANGEF